MFMNTRNKKKSTKDWITNKHVTGLSKIQNE